MSELELGEVAWALNSTAFSGEVTDQLIVMVLWDTVLEVIVRTGSAVSAKAVETKSADAGRRTAASTACRTLVLIRGTVSARVGDGRGNVRATRWF